MCEQCIAEAVMVVENVIPGFHLMQAARGSRHWKKGWYGLVESNDPTLVFEGPLLPDPTHGWSDDAINAMSPEVQARLGRYDASVELLEDALVVDARTGYRIVTACIEAGYNPKEDGFLHYWLMNYMATRASAA
ncbi:hypothetical protein KTD31_00925 [Burkholderia multivorans]|uniref:hypothetical protein n=1 Tax=Burkholderia multivorans TaxID=87883 RepID=UPI001C235C14|nr:hypothetical protein [Burkholderia multivorans]MBU9199964.1 hypothetical protein [Burkholderia multivorans]MDN8078917.1 hypothetical protein [Burkholderia multivorans]